MVSANAKAPRCQTKKIQLQRAFRASCTRKNESGMRLVPNPPERHTSHAEIAIRTYKTVQTGPKSHGGGAHAGWTSPL